MRPEEAYAEVQRITRRRARNFAYGIMVLPRAKRQAIAAVYAFARRVDDVADGELPLAEKRARLEDLAAALDRDPGEDATLVALADARTRFAIPAAALTAMVEGGLQDTEQARYADFAALEAYCRKVAGAVGAACVPIYGAGANPSNTLLQATGHLPDDSGSGPAPSNTLSLSEEAAGPSELGERLGVGLQLINILRDVAEDWRLGRVYLPQDELARFGVAEDDIARGRVTPAWRELAAFQAARAREWLADGSQLLDRLDRRSRLCVATFAGIYASTLDELEARGYDVFAGEVRPSAAAKLRIVGRGLLR